MTYLAAFDGGSRFVDHAELARELEKDWKPSRLVRTPPGGCGEHTRPVDFTFSRGGKEVEGHTFDSGTCLYLDGDADLVVEFVAWYRKLVPSEFDLIFCDDSYSFDVVVPVGATGSDVMAMWDNA
ncbi:MULTISPECIES: hypothetical protein [Actinosynnema]|uniref:hypothetical protein n=1 Tax=Actinosynnema TaxID=40566 RepID=UPI0020A48293|nr:hypothetical protein [Actinosynnema pretiosum]MCP2098860.1 hypothetical protein [Actinosynnema pretiosum]